MTFQEYLEVLQRLLQTAEGLSFNEIQLMTEPKKYFDDALLETRNKTKHVYVDGRVQLKFTPRL